MFWSTWILIQLVQLLVGLPKHFQQQYFFFMSRLEPSKFLFLLLCEENRTFALYGFLLTDPPRWCFWTTNDTEFGGMDVKKLFYTVVFGFQLVHFRLPLPLEMSYLKNGISNCCTFVFVHYTIFVPIMVFLLDFLFLLILVFSFF